MIPKRITVLPCGHILCSGCHVATCRGCGGRCPFDQEPFTEEDCSGYDLPARKANTLKVHCWNEIHGCQFDGVIEDMLSHYENDCSFHTVECFRCGEVLLHRDLPAHCLTGCSASSACAGNNCPDTSTALTLEHFTGALEEVKTLLKDANHEQLLLGVQSQINELTEEVRNHESRTAVITREAGTSVDTEFKVAAPVFWTASQELASQWNTTDSCTFSTPRAGTELRLTPRNEDPFAELPRGIMQNMHKTSWQDYPQHAIAYFHPLYIKCRLALIGPTPISTAYAWSELREKVKYALMLEGIDKAILVSLYPTTFAEITVLHMKDAYFTVEISADCNNLTVRMKFYGMRGNFQCTAPSLKIKVYHWKRGSMDSVFSDNEPCDCKQVRDSWVHRHHYFERRSDCLTSNSYLRKGKIKFELQLSCK